MTRSTPNTDVVVPDHRAGEAWRVDAEGVLHTGDAVPFAQRVCVTCRGGDRS